MRYRLLSRPGCHLCEEMADAVGPAIAATGGTLETVDVDSDPALAGRFGLSVPVLLDESGRVIAKVRDPLAKILKRLRAR